MRLSEGCGGFDLHGKDLFGVADPKQMAKQARFDEIVFGLMRTGQDKPSIAFFLIDNALDGTQKRWNPLDIVDNDGSGELIQIGAWIGGGKLPGLRIFQIGVSVVGKGFARQGGFACLTGTEKGYDRVFSQQQVKLCCDLTWSHEALVQNM